MNTKQYRVIWKRVGWILEKKKRFSKRFYADRLVTLVGPEPWKALGHEPEDYVCCSGFECSCGGRTVKQDSDEKRKDMPPIEYIRMEVREVSIFEWRTCAK